MIFRKLKNKRKDNQVRVMSGEEFIRDVLKWEVDVETKPEPEKKQGRTFCLSDLTDNDIESIDNPENYREFTSKDEAEKWGRSIYDPWGQEVKRFKDIKQNSFVFDKEWCKESSLEYYCGLGYQKINGFYRYNKNVTDKYKYLAWTISEELLLAPRIPENIVVYRYVNEECINELLYSTKFNESKQFYERGFMSTSLLKEIAKDAPDNSVLLKLYVNKATVGAYVNSVVRRNEYEMLLQNNLFLRICKKPYWDEEYGMMIIECKTTSFAMEF